MTYLIGIDSGGTHIVGSAWQADGKLLAQATAGPGNIFLNDTQTLINLKQVIRALTTQLADQPCSQVLVGIAGVETTNNAAAVAQELQTTFRIPTDVISDAQLALLNGLAGADGTLIIAGTGSIVYGHQQGKITRFGGWGQLLGDTGSAYKISEAAMKQALDDYDRQRESALQTLMCELLHANDMKAAVRQYYQLSRETIAAFAAKIAELADRGDVAATTIITQAAQALGQEAIGLLSRYQQPAPMQLALSGSVLTHNAMFRQALIATVQAQYPGIQPVVVTTNNSRGVIFLQRWLN
jgi:N-acetylglucosamine kinase-like BadF-type ATPase